MTQNYYVVDLRPGGIPAVVPVSQTENGRTLHFQLVGDVPSGSVVTLQGTKPDLTAYSKTGTLSGNIATFEEDTQMTAVVGIWDAKIKVTKSGQTVATGLVKICVDRDPLDASTTPSTGQLEGILAEAQEYAAAAQAAAESVPEMVNTALAEAKASGEFDGPQGPQGEQGIQGETGATPDITIGEVSTLPAGSSATATITGTAEDPVLNLGIPKGDKGDKGDKGNTGATGATPDISIGNVQTLSPGSSATASITGTPENPVLNMGIPQGAKGEQGIQGETGAIPAFTIGTVSTLTPGSDATATITGTTAAPVLNLGIPRGATGEVSQADLDAAVATLNEDIATKADQTGYYPGLTAGQLKSNNAVTDQVPYVFRATPHDAGTIEFSELHGVSLGWNQLVQMTTNPKTANGIIAQKDTNGLITLSGQASATYSNIFDSISCVQGHKYACVFKTKTNPNNLPLFVKCLNIGWSEGRYICSADSSVNSNAGLSGLTNGADYTGVSFYADIIDLTLLFGPTIADYLYSVETATAGAGVALAKKWANLTKDYYAYDAGSLQHVTGLVSHQTVGFNQWDEEWEVGTYNATTGEPQASASYWRSKNPIKVISGATYYVKTSGDNLYRFWYDANKNFIKSSSGVIDQLFTVPDGACYLNIVDVSRNAYDPSARPVCINLHWDGERDGDYEPYVKRTYPLDATQTLRGILKLDANNQPYADGDMWKSDGTLNRRYGIVDLGTLTWTNDVTDCVYTTISERLSGSQNGISNGLTQSAITVASADMPDKSFKMGGSTKAVLVKMSGLMANNASTMLNGLYLVYELDTPTTETAEPYQSPQVVFKDGTEEYVYDSSNTTPIPVGHTTKYPTDQVAKLDGLPSNFSTLIAPTETMYKATRNYTSGQLFIVNNILYKATANIANGGTITPNTNCTATTLAEVIAALS